MALLQKKAIALSPFETVQMKELHVINANNNNFVADYLVPLSHKTHPMDVPATPKIAANPIDGTAAAHLRSAKGDTMSVGADAKGAAISHVAQQNCASRSSKKVTSPQILSMLEKTVLAS